jgi:GNAT superfamily N-acetyltransferase
MTPAVVIRPAVDTDADAVADVWLRSFSVTLPSVVRAHTDEEVRGWIRGHVIAELDTWVAEVDGQVVGLLTMSRGWLDQLYLLPEWRGHGIGDRLVELAKDRQPEGLELWTFQVNGPARRFYERHGFVAVELTDGRTNEEREPDVRYRWTPEQDAETPSARRQRPSARTGPERGDDATR